MTGNFLKGGNFYRQTCTVGTHMETRGKCRLTGIQKLQTNIRCQKQGKDPQLETLEKI